MPNTPDLWRNVGQVNQTDLGTPGNSQSNAQITQLDNGNIVVVWQSDTDSGAGSPAGNDIIARVYNAVGTAVTGEFRVNGNSNTEETAPSIAALPGGKFVVAYTDVNNAGQSFIRTTEWSPSIGGGSYINAGDRLIADGSTGGVYVENPAVTARTDGGYVVAYAIHDTTGVIATSILEYGLVTSVGTVSTGFALAPATPSNFDGTEIATLANGNHVVVTVSGPGNDTSISYRLIDGSTGGQMGTSSIFVPGTSDDSEKNFSPSVAALAGGGFVIAWYWSAGAATELHFRLFDDNGNALGPGNTVINGNTEVYRNPEVVALADGGFVLVWEETTGSFELLAQRYNAGGLPVGNQFNVNPQDEPIEAAAIGLADGRFGVVFTRHTATDDDVRLRIYDTRDDENSPNDYTTDQVIGTVGADGINVSSDDNQVYGWFGNDTINFLTPADLNPTAIYDGGFNDDVLRVRGNGTYDFRNADVKNFEQIVFEDIGTTTVEINYDALTLGLDRVVQGSAFGGATNNIVFRLDTGSTADLSTIDFINWENGPRSIGLFGNGGNNTLIADNVYSTVMFGADGDDDIFGLFGDDFIEAGVGNDEVDAGSGKDTIFQFHEGAFTDDIDGGAGLEDTLIFGAANGTQSGNSWTVNLANGTGSSGSMNLIINGIENVTGGSGSDNLTGNNLANIFIGNGGGDSFFGRGGDDLFAGGGGLDSFDGGSGSDTVDYTNNVVDSVIDLGAGTADFGGGFIENLVSIENIDLGSGSDTVTGDSSDNTFFGNDGRDTLLGRGGIDFLFGGGEKDTLNGGSSDDELYGGTRADVLIGASGGDMLNGEGGSDLADYTASNAAVQVNLAENTATGGHAEGDTLISIERLAGSDGFDDILRGDSGANRLFGNGGNDRLSGAEGADIIDGGEGVDRVEYRNSDAGVDVFLASGEFSGGHAEGDTLTNIQDVFGSQDFDDNLRGTDESNWFRGYGGDDRLLGGAGDDKLDGGEDDDMFIFRDGWGNDEVIGFDVSGGDQLNFRTMGLTVNDLGISYGNNSTTITYDGNQIRLIGSTDVLQADDFLF